MNKAFVKEQDTDASHCPQCKSLGKPVGPATLAALLKPEASKTLAVPALFCPFENCRVAYFDAFDRVVTTDMLVRPIYPKDLTAPICPCFGLAIDDIQADIDEGVLTRTREAAQKSKSPEARCSVMSPTGQSCLTEIQRCYRRMRGPE